MYVQNVIIFFIHKYNKEHISERKFPLMKENKSPEEIFEETFLSILNFSSEGDEAPKLIDFDKIVPQGEERINAPSIAAQEMLAGLKDFIPESVNDSKWQSFINKEPPLPLTAQAEARAVTIGLQEVRKMEEYMFYIYRHMTQEFTDLYATFPLMISHYFDEVFNETHKKISKSLEDITCLIAGDIDQVVAVQQDITLYGRFEESRLHVLNSILDYYTNKTK